MLLLSTRVVLLRVRMFTSRPCRCACRGRRGAGARARGGGGAAGPARGAGAAPAAPPAAPAAAPSCTTPPPRRTTPGSDGKTHYYNDCITKKTIAELSGIGNAKSGLLYFRPIKIRIIRIFRIFE